jgi:uncharacterized protein with von Willebrand factor type A (vWA) domain
MKNFGLHFTRSETIESESYLSVGQEMAKRIYTMKAKELDELFDSGKDITEHLDRSTKNRPELKQRRINVDLPDWMSKTLDREASRIGVTRQSIIKVWIAERIKEEAGSSS